MEQGTKEITLMCSTCGEIKDEKCFHIRAKALSGRQGFCKDCCSVRQKIRYAAGLNNPKVMDALSKRNYKNTLKRYGLTDTQHKTLTDKHQGLCAICGEETALKIDHCHLTLIVRGLLCFKCNTGLGLFRDSPKLLNKAAEYLWKSQQT